MKNPRRFKIPLRWCGTEQIETARANVLVLPFTQGFVPVKRAVRVGTIGGKPQYRIECEQTWHRPNREESASKLELFDVGASKLELFDVGANVLVEQKLSEITPFVVAQRDGIFHLVSNVAFHTGSNGLEARFWTVCTHEYGQVEVARYPVGPGTITCPKCLQVETLWLHYVIEPYDPPHEIEKKAKKAKNEVRRRERYPTAFDHLLHDPWSETTPPTPTPPRVAPVKPLPLIRETYKQRDQRRASLERGKSYAEQKAELLRKIRARSLEPIWAPKAYRSR